MKTAKLVTFGRGGDTVEYGRHCRSTGYGTPESPHTANPERCDIPDGCPVIDKRPAIETPEGYSWVFRGPMVDVDLAPNCVDQCPDLSDNIMVRAMAEEPSNGFGQLATLHQAHKAKAKTPGPLDSVDIATFIAGWRDRGARIGHYEHGKIVWDD